MSVDEIKEALRSGKIKVAVYGMGRIGIPLACAWLTAGAKVIGVDVNEKRVAMLNKGINPFKDEPYVNKILREALRNGRFKATINGVEASRESHVKIIIVPVTLKHMRGKVEVNYENLVKVAEAIGRGLKRGDLVILETSVPPGTTRNILKPILERESRLKVEVDFGLAYSPERVAEGRVYLDIIEHYPKIVSGYGEKSLKAVRALYECVCRKGVIEVSKLEAAEFEKLAEGIYRDVNIALANELAILAMKLGLDFNEIRNAANSQPYCHLHKPGVGVGGLCIPVYPYFMLNLAEKLGLKLKLVEIAREINENMPKITLNLIIEAARKIRGKPRIAILGLAFRGNIADTRNSPTYTLIKLLLAKGLKDIIVHDPYIEQDEKLTSLGIRLTTNINEAVKGRNIIVIATDHNDYKRLKPSELLELSGIGKIAIIDGRNVINEYYKKPKNVTYVGVGRPWTE